MKQLILLVLGFGLVLGSLDPTTVALLVEIHNTAREYVYPPALNPIPPVSWSTSLEAGAAALAATCVWNHSQAYYYFVVGETISWSDTEDIVTQVEGWAEVGQALYDVTTNTCYEDQYWAYCDRYTQMIWSTTSLIGCALQTCPGSSPWNFTVCQYSTPGNYVGVPPYTVNPQYLPAGTTASPAYTTAATSAPGTSAPITSARATSAPVTSAPATSAPITSARATSAPVTSARVTSAAAATSAAIPATSASSSTTGGNKPPATGSFDWRTYGGVGPVKNQGSCGCCWAFASTGAVESAYLIKHGINISLSEQELIDCVTSSIGCNGGNINDALVYGQTNGYMLESSDPYKAAYSGECTLNTNELCAAKITEIINVQNTQADLIAAMRSYGPVAVSVGMADQAVWQSYSRGTIECPTTADIDHAVLTIGWSQENSYFIGKNQWGTSWGMNGFFYLDATQNCGLFQYTTQTVTVA